jgi:hypothetical protein
MAARACGSHCVVEEQARVLCWDCMRYDGEAAAVEEHRSPPQVRIRTERAMGYGCAPTAFGTETEKALGRMHGIETTERVMEHEIAVGTKAQETQLASVTVLERRVRERALESMPGKLRGVLARLRESTVGNLKAVLAMLLVHIAVLAHKTDMGHAVVLAVPETGPCTDRGTAVVVVQETLPCGCSAARVARARQPGDVAGS